MTTETESKIGMVLYCDGSARPNPGNVGSGFMAYTYSLDDKGEKSDKYGEYVTTNNGYQKKKAAASDKNNGEISGTLVKPIAYFEGAAPYDGISTNNFAELRAVYEGLRHCWEKNITRLTIVCDSEYTLNTLRRDMHAWAKNNWMTSTGKQVSNLEVVQGLYVLMTSIKESGCEIKFAWVRGHMEIAGNLHADILSNIARSMSLDNKFATEVHQFTPKQFNEYTVEKHPLLTHKRVYFVTDETQNLPGFYLQGDSGAGDFMIGKRLPETGYSVVILNTPDETVEMLKKVQHKFVSGVTRISSLLLDRVFDKKIFKYIDKFGAHSVECDKRNSNINFLDGKPLSMVMNPTGLSLRAIDCFNTLSSVLREYMLNKEAFSAGDFGADKYSARDITDDFFSKEVKKVAGKEVEHLVLKKDYVVGMKNVTLDHTVKHNGVDKVIKVPLIFGTDIPNRNQIKRLEKHNPRIKLITWRLSEDSVNYAIVIDCDDAVGIWSNFYADQVIIF